MCHAHNMIQISGELAERSNAAVLKTVDPKGSGGSNPSLSAIHEKAPERGFFYGWFIMRDANSS